MGFSHWGILVLNCHGFDFDSTVDFQMCVANIDFDSTIDLIQMGVVNIVTVLILRQPLTVRGRR
jgi:hypothetical protein